jgi:hypothetical protein
VSETREKKLEVALLKFIDTHNVNCPCRRMIDDALASPSQPEPCAEKEEIGGFFDEMLPAPAATVSERDRIIAWLKSEYWLGCGDRKEWITNKLVYLVAALRSESSERGMQER